MRKIFLILVSLFLAGCGSREHAGGSGMEIPNSVTMVALQSDGIPVMFGRVRIVTESKWMARAKSGESVVLDSMRTDKHGRFTFSPPETDRVRIEIIHNGEGSSVIFDSTRTTVSLEALGSVQAQWTPGATVMIVGTSISQKVDQNGRVSFTSFPGVNAVLIGLEEDQKPVLFSSMFLKPQETLYLGELQIVKERLLIDDFEKMSRITLLDPFVHGSYWYSVADENQGGNSTINPSTANGNSWYPAISDTAAWNGNSLTIQYHIEASSTKAAYAVFGCTLGNGIQGSAIDSIVFHAHSNGVFFLSNGSQTLLQGPSTTSTGWERFAVYRSDLDSLGINSKIDLLQFIFGDTTGTVFKLDDFAIYGDPFELLQVE